MRKRHESRVRPWREQQRVCHRCEQVSSCSRGLAAQRLKRQKKGMQSSRKPEIPVCWREEGRGSAAGQPGTWDRKAEVPRFELRGGRKGGPSGLPPEAPRTSHTVLHLSRSAPWPPLSCQNNASERRRDVIGTTRPGATAPELSRLVSGFS